MHKESNMVARWVKRGVRIAMVALVAVVVCGFLVMALWNWLAPPLLGARPVTFWQALGIFVLCKILFGGLRGGSGGGRWRGRMRARWEQMSPEEREKFRQGLAGSCGGAAAQAGRAAGESGTKEG